MNVHRFATLFLVLLAVAGAATAVAQPTATDGAGGGDADAAATDTVTITVHLRNTIGRNVSDAEVTASWDGGSATATTLSNGEALLDVDRGARVEVTVDHPDYARNDPFVIRDARSRTYDVLLYPAASAEVTVTADGSPVEGATVTLSKEGRDGVAASGTTGADGVFATDEPIESGTYTVAAVKPGFARSETVVTVAESTEVSVGIDQEEVILTVEIVDDHFDPPREVTGTTIEYEALVDSADVTGGQKQVGGTGTTSIALAVNAEYRLVVRKDGYETARRTVSVAEDDRTVRVTVSREPSLTVEPDNREVLVGNRVDLTVTDEYDDPVANASILVDGTRVGETNADGEFRATLDSAGNHSITARKGGVTADAVAVEAVSPGGDATPTATATGTTAATPTGTSAGTGETPDLDLGQPRLVVQVGVAALGVVLAFLVVRRLL